MSSSRALGLFITAAFIAVAAVSAQQPPKTPPAKPGDPKMKPGDPKSIDPKVKVPMPMLPPKPPTPPAKDDTKWPPEVNGRGLKDTVRDMRSNTDPAIREASIRALPYFGPKGRAEGADELLDAMTKELDTNVMVAAIEVAPTVLLGFADDADPILAKGLNTIYNKLSSPQMHVKFVAVAAIGTAGPYMRVSEPRTVSALGSLARDQYHWQMRRAAVTALGRIAVGMPSAMDPDKKDPPDTPAVGILLDVLKTDRSAAVRREAVNSLIGVGPVAPSYHKTWRSTLDEVFSKGIEKDKAVMLWVHVLIIRNDPNGLKGNEAHLDAIAKLLTNREAGARLEACQALGFLGEDAKTKLDDLIKIINNETVPDVIAAAIIAVTAMPKESAITLPILNNVKSTHPNMDVRKYAEEAIKFLTSGKKN